MTTHEEETVLLAMYVATSGVADASVSKPVLAAFLEAFTFAELEEMARKLTAARHRLDGAQRKDDPNG